MASKSKAHVVKVSITGIPWKIRFVTTKQMEKIFPEQPLLGLTDPAKQSVYVDYQRTKSTVTSTLFHELTHAFCANLMGSNESQQGAINEEAACNCVGNGMVEILPHLDNLLKLINELTLPYEDEE